MNLLEKIDDLIVQATTERSHYYTASVLREAASTIRALVADRDHWKTFAEMERQLVIDYEAKVTEQAARISALEESVLLINRVAKDSSVSDEQVFQEAERLARKIKGTEH